MSPDENVDEQPEDEFAQRKTRRKTDGSSRLDPTQPQVLKADIGKVVGGPEAISRFKYLVAKTLRLSKS